MIFFMEILSAEPAGRIGERACPAHPQTFSRFQESMSNEITPGGARPDQAETKWRRAPGLLRRE
jgi:hypothetical protein